MRFSNNPEWDYFFTSLFQLRCWLSQLQERESEGERKREKGQNKKVYKSIWRSEKTCCQSCNGLLFDSIVSLLAKSKFENTHAPPLPIYTLVGQLLCYKKKDTPHRTTRPISLFFFFFFFFFFVVNPFFSLFFSSIIFILS